MSLPWQAQVENTIYGLETHWFWGKENVPGARISKEGHADSLLEHERNHHYWFPQKGATVNSAYYCKSFGKICFIYWMNLIYIYIYIYISNKAWHIENYSTWQKNHKWYNHTRIGDYIYISSSYAGSTVPDSFLP